MSDLFEKDDDAVIETEDDLGEVDGDIDVEPEVIESELDGLDARRRLENMLDEKRLRDELEDFLDY